MTTDRLVDDPLTGFDVLAAFEKDMGEEGPDTVPLYAELRETHPVYRGDVITEKFGLPASTLTVWPGPAFTILGYREVQQVLLDAEHFSNTVFERTVGRSMGRNLLTIDDPEHRVHRKLIQGVFSKRAMERWRDEVIRPTMERAMDAMAPRRSAEMVTDFTISFPVSVIHELLGLPPTRLMELHTLAVGLLLYRTRPDVTARCSERLGRMLTGYVQDRRRRPGDDVISLLAGATSDTGESLTDEEVVAFLRVLMPAGGETTTRTLGSLFAHLLTEPGLLDRIRADRSLLPQAVEETLRLDAPTQFVYRLCVADTEVAGVPIPAGAPIAVALAAANRDPAAFSDPDLFDLDRTSAAHMAFGFGTHVCLGMHLARLETIVATEVILDRLPGLRLDPTRPPPKLRGVTFRSPDAVHVLWN